MAIFTLQDAAEKVLSIIRFETNPKTHKDDDEEVEEDDDDDEDEGDEGHARWSVGVGANGRWAGWFVWFGAGVRWVGRGVLVCAVSWVSLYSGGPYGGSIEGGP